MEEQNPRGKKEEKTVVIMRGTQLKVINHPREGRNPRGERGKYRSDCTEGNNQLKPSKGRTDSEVRERGKDRGDQKGNNQLKPSKGRTESKGRKRKGQK